MTNIHSTDGIAEDLIRSFVQMACAEVHAKTLLEKRTSELDNGIGDIGVNLAKIEDLKEEIAEYSQIRREDMLYLFDLYEPKKGEGDKRDKEQWCMVKHLGIAMMTAFECWQATDDSPDLLNMVLRKNRLFIKAITKFIGVEITDCASCFGDILKGEAYETTHLQSQ